MTTQLREALPLRASEEDLLDLKEACRFFGGSRPLNAATLYRGVRLGRYPAPIKVGPNASRWLRSELDAALQSMISTRRVSR
jgi:predicted DNA-binding transcriptional regulator AlpA